MAKVRVYELLKEFGVESKAVMAKLESMGEFVRSRVLDDRGARGAASSRKLSMTVPPSLAASPRSPSSARGQGGDRLRAAR